MNKPQRTEPVYRLMARALEAMANCERSGNKEWASRHEERAHKLTAACLPSGSGWDSGTAIDLDKSRPDRLVFYGSFHHMDEHGTYDGWTDHTVVVTPSLVSGFDVRVTGKNRDDIKDYLGDLFTEELAERVAS